MNCDNNTFDSIRSPKTGAIFYSAFEAHGNNIFQNSLFQYNYAVNATLLHMNNHNHFHLINSVVKNNTAEIACAGFIVNDSRIRIMNNTFIGNKAKIRTIM